MPPDWRDDLKSQIASLTQSDWMVQDSRVEWAELHVDARLSMPPGELVGLIGRVNASELARQDPGHILLIGVDFRERRSARLRFAVRRMYTWNHVLVVRDGARDCVEVFDRDGMPPYLPGDLDRIG